ncbi:MAG: hypothetical protein NTV80_18890 [Verrucomicrobia bacterium]|nr:hypothetical protein [Verrucomicrobiota bacterium]
MSNLTFTSVKYCLTTGETIGFDAGFAFELPLAAEGGTAIGWLLVALFVLSGKWGWIGALALIPLIWSLRNSRSTLGALIVAFAFPTSMMLLAASAVYYAMPTRNTEPQPMEVRPAGLTDY